MRFGLLRAVLGIILCGCVVSANSAEPKLKVLVTAFNDFAATPPPDPFVCDANQSCRLLLQEPVAETADQFDGPLARRLNSAEEQRTVQFEFLTLPVTWGAFDSIPQPNRFDCLILLGSGTQEHGILKLENGAYNDRRGVDMAGAEGASPIREDAPLVLMPADESGVRQLVESLHETKIDEFVVEVAAARPGSTYLCNETHYLALEAMNRSLAEKGRLRAVFFVHVPPKNGETREELAQVVAQLIRRLVTVQRQAPATEPAPSGSAPIANDADPQGSIP